MSTNKKETKKQTSYPPSAPEKIDPSEYSKAFDRFYVKL